MEKTEVIALAIYVCNIKKHKQAEILSNIELSSVFTRWTLCCSRNIDGRETSGHLSWSKTRPVCPEETYNPLKKNSIDNQPKALNKK